MITFDDALRIAKSKWDGINYCTERENAYVFSKFNDDSIGGSSPVVVMKDSGDTYDFAYYLAMFRAPTIREGALSEFSEQNA